MTNKAKPAAAETPVSKQQSTAELTADFERQREEICTVEVLLATRQTERQSILLSGTDADVIEHDRRTAALALRRDRAAARIEVIRRDHPAAAERELTATKLALRGEAEEKRKAGTAAYLRAEAKLREVFADLAVVFAADAAIANANLNAAAGAAPLLPCEADFRWVESIPDRTETVQRRWPKEGMIFRPGTNDRPEHSDVTEMTTRIVRGCAAVRPAPLYDVLTCPALRPDDAPLRIPGTPISLYGHAKQTLTPPPALPADAPAIAPVDAARKSEPRSHALRVHGLGR